jgi:hypothetical protein
MTAGSGTPSLRIWPSGTHRILGIVNVDHPIADDAYAPTVPDNILELLSEHNHFTAWGDFYVCPVAPERAGRMRFVIVKRARNVFAKPN